MENSFSNIRKWIFKIRYTYYFLILENDFIILENEFLVLKNDFLILENNRYFLILEIDYPLSFSNIRKWILNMRKTISDIRNWICNIRQNTLM